MSTQVVKQELINNFEHCLDAINFEKQGQHQDVVTDGLMVAAIKASHTAMCLQPQNPKAIAELNKLEQQFQDFIANPSAVLLGPILQQLMVLGQCLQGSNTFRVNFLKLMLKYSATVHPQSDANDVVRLELLAMLSKPSFVAENDLTRLLQFVVNWNELINNAATEESDHINLYQLGLENFDRNNILWSDLLCKYRRAYITDLSSNQELAFKQKVSSLKALGNPFLTCAVDMMQAEYLHPANTIETKIKLYNDLRIVEKRCQPHASNEIIGKFNEIVDGYVGCSSQFLRGAGIALVVLGLGIMSATLAIVAWHVLPLTALPLFVAQHILQLSVATFSGGAIMTMAGALLYHHNYVDEKGVCMQELQKDMEQPSQGPKRGH